MDPAAEDVAVAEHPATAGAVDVCMVLATPDGPSDEVNKKLTQYVNKHSTRTVGFATFEPGKDKTSPDKLKSIQEKSGLKGVVLHCSARGFHPAHSSAMRFYESAQELALPVFFHNAGDALRSNGVMEYAQPYLLDEVAREFTALKIIIGSMGVPFVEQTLSMVARHENVYADLTIRPKSVWQTYNMVVAAYERGVMDKLLFGSGFPLGDAGECMETLLGFNMLLADTNLPTVPRVSIRNIIERDTFRLLGIDHEIPEAPEPKPEKSKKKRKKKDQESKDAAGDNGGATGND
jgi:predicted TIM-barrel fold metal-dependent hydrolase